MLVFVVIVVAFSAQVDSCGAWPAGKWWSRNATFTTPGGTWTLIFDNSRQDTFTYLEANFTSCDPTVLGVETRIGTQLQRRLAVRVTQERLTAELINGDAEPVPNFNEQYRFIVHDSTTYDACTQER
ncbi:hypothetical protein BaRGS_00018627 [Batillaria attramentaria]|uniref:Uncharacterized protein n=1 Tax=Batillaria attramentaria TaxID=370345 RepID=A0ABD0KTE2_9CAEN